MNTFGKIKSKLLTRLTESYSSNNKNEMKELLKVIKENKDFKELYLFYEEIENMELSYPDSAQLYVETVEPLLIERAESVKKLCQELSTKIGDVKYETNEIYECLDILSQKPNLNNLDQKVTAKKKLIDHLKTKKQITESKDSTYTANENLLHAVLANNFNILYNNTLNENQKEELKNILSLSNEDVELKMKELKESILTKVDSLLSESKENELVDKLTNVKNEVNQTKPSKLNYFRLTELKNGLN